MTVKPFVSLLLALCACGPAFAGDPPDADRKAILTMQGGYEVDFAFDETTLLKPGYERAAAERAAGDEAVIVVEDTPAKIVLQHVLVDPKSGHVTKHWRQDWTFETAKRFEFDGGRTWAVRGIPAELTRGAWTQCVFEVDDAPRYCGTGKWTHERGVSTWTSDTTWRPLPRREYTRRSDYNALEVINRHTIVAGGWTHEQLNTKVLRKADGSREDIVREFGFNDYRKAEDTDFKPAYAYWDATRDYWAKVRARWSALLDAPPGLHLKTKIDGMQLIMALFTQADDVQQGKAVADADIDKAFAEWVEPAAVTGAAANR
jgi:hypothetical protein